MRLSEEFEESSRFPGIKRIPLFGGLRTNANLYLENYRIADINMWNAYIIRHIIMVYKLNIQK